MTLDKHDIQGVHKIGCRVLPITEFEQLVTEAGYYKTSTAPAFRNRIKVWFSHSCYNRLECIYDLVNNKCVTAYHK